MPHAADRPSAPKRLLLSWSSGKDSLWTLRFLREDPGVDVVGLFTTCNKRHDRVAMHGVRGTLLEAQADALGLPLVRVDLPDPCTNEDYHRVTETVLIAQREAGVTGLAFGDLFLEDVRAFREEQLAPLGLESHFPLWGLETRELAREMIDSCLRAHLTCLDPKRIPADLVGSIYDEALLERLPADADPCGENGEFHTFVSDGPGFDAPIPVRLGERVNRGGFEFIDLLADD